MFSGRKNAFILATIISSVAFAMIHFFNLFEQTLIGTIMQVYFALAIGVCYVGIYMLSGTLLIPVLLHGIVDAGVFLLVTDNNAVANSVNWIQMGLSTLILVEGIVLVIIFQKKKDKEGDT